MSRKSATHAVDKAKNKQLAIIVSIILIVVILSSCGLFAAFYYRDYSVNPEISEDYSAKNVILLIGDGLGQNQIDTANLVQSLSMTSADYSGTISTRSFSLTPTDSAASATAMATGQKVFNGNVSYFMGESLTNLGSLVSASGKRLGFVTNGDANNATIAAFSSSVKSSDSLDEIALQQVQNTGIDYLVGTGSSYYDAYIDDINTTSRTYINSYEDLKSCVSDQQFAILGDDAITASGSCSLATLTQDALDKLDNNEEGFFLVVESDTISTAAQNNDMDSLLTEISAFDAAVEAALIYAAMNKDDTLVIVVGDHETGKLSMPEDNDTLNISSANFGSKGNTYSDVRYYATGVGAEAIPSAIDNSDIYNILVAIMGLK